MASTPVPGSRSGGYPVVPIAIVTVLLIIGGILIGSITPSILPPQASAEAQQIDNLFQIMLVIGGVVFLLVQGLLVYSIIKFRAKANDTSDGINLHGNTTLEIVWTAIPAVVVVVLTILSWNVYGALFAPRENATVIGTAAARFNWNFEYQAPLDILPYEVDVSTLPQAVKDDLATDNLVSFKVPQLHTYIGENVELDMQSVDVIHAFWVPAFRLKQDVIPGRVTTIKFTPIEVDGALYQGEYNTEAYPLKCAELCGAAHGAMYTYVNVHRTEADYTAWLANMVEQTIFPPPDPALRGRLLLSSNTYACNTCHVLGDLAEFNWNGNVGPALNGVSTRAAGSRASATGQDPNQYLYTAIHEPGAYIVPGYNNLMPVLAIPECQTWDIIAYLRTQTADGSAPTWELDEPEECVTAGGPGGPPPGDVAEPSAEATSEATTEPMSEATADATPAG